MHLDLIQRWCPWPRANTTSKKHEQDPLPAERKHWIFDTSAAEHACNDRVQYVDFHEFEEPHFSIDSTRNWVGLYGEGTVVLPVLVDGIVETFELANVWYRPNLPWSVMSWTKLRSEYQLRDDGQRFQVLQDGKVMLECSEGVLINYSNAGLMFVITCPPDYEGPPVTPLPPRTERQETETR